MVVEAKTEIKKFDGLKFWMSLTLKWIKNKDNKKDTNIFTTSRFLLGNSSEWVDCFSKDFGGFEGI